MTPIEGVSEIRRLPRLGKIRLGIKKEGKGTTYPSPTDYFVCPDEVKAVYTEKPTELKVMFPVDDLELVAPQWYKCYSYSQNLICKGNGKTCRRKVDTDTGDFADRDTKHWDMADGVCDPDDCPKLAQKQCRRVMSLLFILPDVPGLGIYQLDTTSFYSIVNINSQLGQEPPGFLRQFTRGRIAFLPLILSMGPQVVTPPGEGRKTVHVLNVRADVKLADLIRLSHQKPAQVLLPTLTEEEAPEDLYPQEVISEGGETPPPAEEKPATSAEASKEPEAQPARVPDTCSCHKPVSPTEVYAMKDGTCWHTTCGGYLCTPPIDCFPGCPHTPLVAEAAPAEKPQEAKVGEAIVGKSALGPPASAPEKAGHRAAKARPFPTRVSGPEEPGTLPKAPDDVVEDDVPDIDALFQICFHFWGMQPNIVCKELGYRTPIEAYSARAKPWESFLTIKRLKQGRPE